MSRIPTRALAEGAMLAATAVVMALLGQAPGIAIALRFGVATTFAIALMRLGPRVGGMTILVAVASCGIVAGAVTAARMMIPFGGMGVLLGLLRRRYPGDGGRILLPGIAGTSLLLLVTYYGLDPLVTGGEALRRLEQVVAVGTDVCLDPLQQAVGPELGRFLAPDRRQWIVSSLFRAPLGMVVVVAVLLFWLSQAATDEVIRRVERVPAAPPPEPVRTQWAGPLLLAYLLVELVLLGTAGQRIFPLTWLFANLSCVAGFWVHLLGLTWLVERLDLHGRIGLMNPSTLVLVVSMLLPLVFPLGLVLGVSLGLAWPFTRRGSAAPPAGPPPERSSPASESE